MKLLPPLLLLCSLALADPVATVHRQDPVADANLTILTVEVVADDGMIYPFRTRLKGTVAPTQKQLDDRCALLVQMVEDMIAEQEAQAEADAVAETAVPLAEIDAVVAKIQKEGKPITATTWDELKAEADAIAVVIER